jgi:hypothetical protein
MRLTKKPFKIPKEWTRWFAWYPVDVGDHIVWLEYVEYATRFVYTGSYTEYRLLQKSVDGSEAS